MDQINGSEMKRLYDVALKELEKISRLNSLNEFYETQLKNQDEYKRFNQPRKEIDIDNKKYNYTYNKQNAQLIINDKEIKPANNVFFELQDFIYLLKLLKKIDEKFIKMIIDYLPIRKNTQDYYDVQEALMTALEYNNEGKSRKVLKLAIDDIFNYDFKTKSLSQLYIIFYNKLFAHISYYYDAFLNTLAEYYIGNLCKGYKITDNSSVKDYIDERINENDEINSFMAINQNLIFLSYAIKDRFFSLLLYLDAISKNRILFVDWMFNPDRSGDIKTLKKNLGYFLRSANKLLFLQSFQSELFVEPNFGPKNEKHLKMIRQWCAWEIGAFHSNNYNCIEENDDRNIMFKYALNETLTKELNKKRSKKNSYINNFLGDFSAFQTFLII